MSTAPVNDYEAIKLDLVDWFEAAMGADDRPENRRCYRFQVLASVFEAERIPLCPIYVAEDAKNLKSLNEKRRRDKAERAAEKVIKAGRAKAKTAMRMVTIEVTGHTEEDDEAVARDSYEFVLERESTARILEPTTEAGERGMLQRHAEHVLDKLTDVIDTTMRNADKLMEKSIEMQRLAAEDNASLRQSITERDAQLRMALNEQTTREIQVANANFVLTLKHEGLAAFKQLIPALLDKFAASRGGMNGIRILQAIGKHPKMLADLYPALPPDIKEAVKGALLDVDPEFVEALVKQEEAAGPPAAEAAE